MYLKLAKIILVLPNCKISLDSIKLVISPIFNFSKAIPLNTFAYFFIAYILVHGLFFISIEFLTIAI